MSFIRETIVTQRIIYFPSIGPELTITKTYSRVNITKQNVPIKVLTYRNPFPKTDLHAVE